MKAAVVLGQFPKLSERFIARELADLRRKGLELHVFALRAGPPALMSEEPFAALRGSVTIVPHWFSLRTVAAKLRQPLRSLRALRAFQHLPASLAAAPLGTLRALPHCNRAYPLVVDMLAADCDVIWAHWAATPGVVGMTASWISGLPLLLSCHAWDIFANRTLVAAQLRTAAAVTVCSRAARDHLLSHYAVDENKLNLVHHGVEIPAGFPPPSSSPRDRPMRLLGIGRFVRKKGFEHLLAAAGHGEFEVELMGAGPLESRLRASADSLGLAERLFFSPMGGAAEIRAAFERCDAICAPSVLAPDGDRDGVPNVLLEATAAGLPIVATNAGGLGDLVEHESSGLVIEPAAPRSIADAAGRLRTEEGLAARLVEGARARLREQFNLGRSTDRLAELLRSLAP